MCLCVEDALKTTKTTKNGVVTNKNFWKTMKPFLTNKGNLENPEIMLQDKGNIASDESVLVKTFNGHYINLVKSRGVKNLQIFHKNMAI